MGTRKATLSKSQLNTLATIIQGLDLDHSEFQIETVESYQMHDQAVTKLTHQPTGYYFLFDIPSQGYSVEYKPGLNAPIEDDYILGWDDVLTQATRWLEILKREIVAPDLWRLFTEEAERLEAGLGSDEGNEPFTAEEKQWILSRLDEVQRYLIDKQDLLEGQRQYVEERFDELKESLERVGRSDWKYIAMGVLFEISWRLALQTSIIRHVFTLLAPLFSGDFPQIPF